MESVKACKYMGAQLVVIKSNEEQVRWAGLFYSMGTILVKWDPSYKVFFTILEEVRNVHSDKYKVVPWIYELRNN